MIADVVVDAAGEATVWVGRPESTADERGLASQMGRRRRWGVLDADRSGRGGEQRGSGRRADAGAPPARTAANRAGAKHALAVNADGLEEGACRCRLAGEEEATTLSRVECPAATSKEGRTPSTWELSPCRARVTGVSATPFGRDTSGFVRLVRIRG